MKGIGELGYQNLNLADAPGKIELRGNKSSDVRKKGYFHARDLLQIYKVKE